MGSRAECKGKYGSMANLDGLECVLLTAKDCTKDETTSLMQTKGSCGFCKEAVIEENVSRTLVNTQANSGFRGSDKCRGRMGGSGRMIQTGSHVFRLLAG